MEDLFLGLDFGTESVRAILVDRDGRERGHAVAPFLHGQLVPDSPAAARLFPRGLPARFALQHPGDWLDAATAAVAAAGRSIDRAGVAGIGVDFTSCTMLPCDDRGVPLCHAGPKFADDPHAWPKLWKHHGALEQTEVINHVARQRGERFLSRYGGVIGLEWLFPKMLEVFDQSPAAFEAAKLWIEAGDWFVWQLVGGEVDRLPRSTCQAGYKACWSRGDGYPTPAFLEACRPGFSTCLRAMRGEIIAPGEIAGTLCEAMALRLGLRSGIPVSAAIIDAHAGVPGAGVADAGTLVMVLGTSGCHMLMSRAEQHIPGIAGIVRDGILPGFVGYETGQAAMGDAFDWARRLAGEPSFARFDEQARAIAPGCDGLVALDWLNGCRTPLMDGSLKGLVAGLTLRHTGAHVYRSMLEASAMGLRWIVATLRDGGVPVERFVATGGLPHHNPLFVEIIAAALGAPVEVHGAVNGPALGAAILGASAAGLFPSIRDGVSRLAGPSSAQPAPRVVRPDDAARRAYDALFKQYLARAQLERGPW